jgi:hypothetical protein
VLKANKEINDHLEVLKALLALDFMLYLSLALHNGAKRSRERSSHLSFGELHK